MSYIELVHAVSALSCVSKKDVRLVLEAFKDITVDTVKSGERVVLPGFGVFVLDKSQPRDLFGGTRKTKGEKIKFRASRRM